jgi:hypothetical protein
MRRLVLLFALGVLSMPLLAQEFSAKGKLETVSADGFYKVFLSPAEATFLNEALTNARVLDSKNIEVPYLLVEESPVYLQQFFKEYEIQSKKITPKVSTIIRLHNPDQTPINNISLVLKNAEAQKTASLTGSDDGKQWFVVREDFTFYPVNNANSVSEVRAIEFPLTNYTYYQLEISDSTSAPLNILKAGYYDKSVTHGLFTTVPDSVSISTNIQEKRTYITLKFKEGQVIDKLELSMKGTTFFQRSGFVTVENIRKVKKREERYTEHVENFVVRSGQTTLITFTGLKTNNLTLCIENGDSPALSVGEVNAYQLNRYLIAWLTKGQSYTIGFTGKDVAPPSYDLEYFRDSIPANAQVLKISDLKPILKPTASGAPTFFTSKTIIWIAIGGVIVLLGFMSLKLVRETSKTEKDSNP